MLVDLIQKLLPKTYEKIFSHGSNYGRQAEADRQRDERAKIHLYEMEQWVGKKVIIVSNEWTDPFIGKVIGLENFGRDEAHIVAQNALTHEVVISFGKVIPFTVESLKALVTMSPWTRWMILTGQNISRDPPDVISLKSFDRLMGELHENKFFDEPPLAPLPLKN